METGVVLRMLLYGRVGFEATRTGRGAIRCSCMIKVRVKTVNWNISSHGQYKKVREERVK